MSQSRPENTRPAGGEPAAKADPTDLLAAIVGQMDPSATYRDAFIGFADRWCADRGDEGWLVLLAALCFAVGERTIEVGDGRL